MRVILLPHLSYRGHLAQAPLQLEPGTQVPLEQKQWKELEQVHIGKLPSSVVTDQKEIKTGLATDCLFFFSFVKLDAEGLHPPGLNSCLTDKTEWGEISRRLARI